MFQQFPKSIWFWLVTVFVGIIMGIGPGIVVSLEHYQWFAALIGWFAFPISLYMLITGQSNTDTGINTWLMYLIYPFAMLGYSACAYWTIRRTGIMYTGLVVAIIAAAASTLMSILVGEIGMSINQEINFVTVFFHYGPALLLHGIVFIQLLISAVLGWLIAAGLVRFSRRNILVAA